MHLTFYRLVSIVLCLLVTACSTVSWWRYAGDSVTFNQATMVFEQRWFLLYRYNRACAVWNTYWGGVLESSKLYTGTFSHNTVYLYNKRELYGLGTTVWNYIEPIIMSLEDSRLTVRLEPPAGEGSVEFVTFDPISNLEKPESDGSFQTDLISIPEINERKECEMAITAASS